MYLLKENINFSSVALVDDSEATLTYGQLEEIGSSLFSGVPERSLVFILADNSIGSFIGYWASMSNGIVPLLLNHSIDRELLSNLIEAYHPSYIWCPFNKSFNSSFKVVLESFKYKLISTGLDSPALNEKLSLLLPTSGSTGSPKLVRHSYVNLSSSASSVSTLFQFTPNDVSVAVLPMYYTMGLSVINSILFAGGTALLSNRSLTDRDFWGMLKNHDATCFTGVPYSYEVLEKIRFRRMELPKLRILAQGGGKLNESLFKTFAEYSHSHNKLFFATYGQTEGTARMAYLSPELATTKTCSIGRPIPDGQLELIDANGEKIIEPEGIGELVYYGKNVTLGYALHKDDLMKGDDNMGFLRTGDIARRDKDGCYYILGRNSRFLKIFGSRISLDDIEQIVKNSFDTDCYCSGSDDKMQVFITTETLIKEVKSLIIEKTGLFINSFEVVYTEAIKRNEFGKVIYH